MGALVGPKLLSRIAESLYWLGRYVERAEDTARILDVHFHLLLEDRWVDEEAAGRVLLTVMGFPAADGDASDSVLVTRALAFDPDYSGSIVRSVEAAWERPILRRRYRESGTAVRWCRARCRRCADKA